MDCIFCKIIAGEIPSKKLYEDEDVLAFLDVSPQAPVHFNVIPKEHIESMAAITPQNSAILAKIGEVIAKLAKEQHLEGGFRVITNTGVNGAQSVKHLHFHVLGGVKLSESLC